MKRTLLSISLWSVVAHSALWAQAGAPALPSGALRLVSYTRQADRVALCAEEPGPPIEQGGRLIRRTRVWVDDGVEIRKVGTAGACDPAWSADGVWVAVTAPDGLWVYTADLRVTIHLVDKRHHEAPADESAHQTLSSPAWSPDGGRLAFTVRADAASWVEVIDARTGHVVHTSGPDLDTFVWGADSRSLRFGERVVRVP